MTHFLEDVAHIGVVLSDSGNLQIQRLTAQVRTKGKTKTGTGNKK